METDRELLELAAKAAGLKDARWDEFYSAISYTVDNGLKDCPWNPLNNDSEAFRLAVEMELCISQWPRHVPPDVMVGYRKGPDDGANLTEEYGLDPCAATRRAIVRAVAEIERATKET